MANTHFTSTQSLIPDLATLDIGSSSNRYQAVYLDSIIDFNTQLSLQQSGTVRATIDGSFFSTIDDVGIKAVSSEANGNLEDVVDSPLLQLEGAYWDGAASQVVSSSLQYIVEGFPLYSSVPTSRLAFGINNTELMSLRSDGKVGFNTSNPGREFQMVSTSGSYVAEINNSDPTAASQYRIENDLVGSFLLFTLYGSNSRDSFIDNSGGLLMNDNHPRLIIGGAGEISFVKQFVRSPDANSEILRIDSAGRLDAPNNSSQVLIGYPSTTIGNNAALRFNFGADYSGIQGEIVDSTTGSESGKLDFVTSNSGNVAKRMTLTSSGSLGINTLSPTAKFHLSGNGNTSATTTVLVQDYTGSDIMTILDDGKVGIGTTPSTILDVEGSFSTSVGHLDSFGENDLDISANSVWKVATGSSNINITGLVFVTRGYYVEFHNVSRSNSITFTHEDINSSPSNRFKLPGGLDVKIEPDEAASFRYDSDANKWRLIS